MEKKIKERAFKKAKSLHYTLNTIKDQVWNTNSFFDYSLKRLGWIPDLFKWTSTKVFLILIIIIGWSVWIITHSFEAFFWFCLFAIIIFATIKILFIINKDSKTKKLKHNWKWIVKHLKITSIEKFITSWDEYSDNEIFYYVQVKDWSKILYSTPYSKWEVRWISKENLRNIYWMYWYEYDEKELHKQEVLTKIDKTIINSENSSKKSNGIKKIIINWKIKTSEDIKNIVEKWYTPTYWEVNWKKITVGDYVDVYFDPKNPKYYWIDIDYLFDR